MSTLNLQFVGYYGPNDRLMLSPLTAVKKLGLAVGENYDARRVFHNLAPEAANVRDEFR